MRKRNPPAVSNEVALQRILEETIAAIDAEPSALASLAPEEIVSADALLPGLDSPSPSDLRRVLERIPVVGEVVAIRGAALKVKQVRRIALTDPDVFGLHFREAIEAHEQLRMLVVDARMEELASDPETPASLVLAWAKRWHPAYRDKQTVHVDVDVDVDVDGEVQVRLDDVFALLHRQGAVRSGSPAAALSPAPGVLAAPAESVGPADGLPAPGPS